MRKVLLLLSFCFVLDVCPIIAQTISLIGTATPANDWDTDFNMIQDVGNPDLWTLTIVLTANEVKFRQDGNWVNNWGNTSFPSGTGLTSGPNIPVAADATYNVTFNTGTLAYSFDLTGSGNVGIGTATPNPSAILDISSLDKGVLVPRMTMAQRGAIVSPQTGLLIFQTDNSPGFYYNAGTPGTPSWQPIGGGSAGEWSVNGTSIYYNTGNVGIGNSSPAALLDVSGDVRINSLTIGKGAGNLSSNTAIGKSALASNTIGFRNTAVGDSALIHNGTGATGTESTVNTAIGANALKSNTVGYGNAAVGSNAVEKNVSGILNSAVGYYALANNTNGSRNVAFGNASLLANSEGYMNTALGSGTLTTNTTGHSNVAVGTRALYNNTVRSNLVAVGDSALYNNGINVTASGHAAENTAIGSKVLLENTTGYQNTGTGYNSLKTNIDGWSNSAFGCRSLFSNSSGGNNSAVGFNALSGNLSGSQNTAVGTACLSNVTTGNYNTALGAFAGTSGVIPGVNNTTSINNNGYLNAFHNQVFIGNTSVLWIGGQVTWGTYSDERMKRNIQENVPGLAFINRLKPVTYYLDIRKQAELSGNADTPDFPHKYDIEDIRMTGFLAQEVAEAAFECNYDFSGVQAPKTGQMLYTLSYEQFVVPLVKAVQELSAQNAAQLQMIEELERKVEALEGMSK